MKQFDDWNRLKKRTDVKNMRPQFKEREVFYARLGANVGHEQDVPLSPINNRQSVALLSQLRLLDAKRLERKIGMVSTQEYSRIKKAIEDLLWSDGSISSARRAE